ncbi:sulfite oxidase [Evansella sp. AB-rgal1]|uniref:sulfite oxidase n=1 Tax=Evansella sp. AB-rgal1 TaxID=3242696 RepID=UPI00359CF060
MNTFLPYPFLITRNLIPENQEAPIHFLQSNFIHENYFYLRSHFHYPVIKEIDYCLKIIGEVFKEAQFSIHDLLNLPSRSLEIVLECAGNKRSLFDPKVFGEQWENGAINYGTWSGVSLRDLLTFTGIKQSALEITFTGHDDGIEKGKEEKVSYTRSLPLWKALHPDTIIAYAFNNKPIPFKHGSPFRLIVPQWYGMASVKWLKEIKVINHHYEGKFQTDDYMYYPNIENDENVFPVTEINVNSTIQQPINLTTFKVGVIEVNGIAWTGKGMIQHVFISIDNGDTWEKAMLHSKGKYGWVSWKYLWRVTKKGEYTVLCKAADSEGRTQPEVPYWNRKGYGYNGVHKIQVMIE